MPDNQCGPSDDNGGEGYHSRSLKARHRRAIYPDQLDHETAYRITDQVNPHEIAFAQSYLPVSAEPEQNACEGKIPYHFIKKGGVEPCIRVRILNARYFPLAVSADIDAPRKITWRAECFLVKVVAP